MLMVARVGPTQLPDLAAREYVSVASRWLVRPSAGIVDTAPSSAYA